MSDLATVVLALAACAGAWAARPLPVVPAVACVAVALALRRPVLLVVGVAVAASAFGARAWDGLRPPALGPWSGVATLVDDPGSVAGALRVDVRIAGKRVEAWARGPAARTLRSRLAGERVHLRGHLQAVPADARRRLAVRHVAARMTVEGAAPVSPGDLPSRLANGLRRTLLGGAEVLPAARRALFAGFVLGDDRDQRPEVTDDFRASGLSHLLVVSGQNVAFVLGLLAPFLGRLRLGGRLAGGVAALVLFGILTRWEPSVLRAVAMAGLTLLASAMGRPASSLRILSLAGAGLVLVDPLLVHSLGFLLSVGACAGIAVLARPLAARLPGPRPVATAMGTTLAAQVGVLPIQVPVFGGLPVAALPANLVGAPVAGPLMMWGMAGGLIAGWGGEVVAGVIHVPTNLMIAWVAGVAHWAARAPFGQLRLWHVVALLVVLLAGWQAHRRGRRPLVIGAGLVGGAVALAPAVALFRPPPVDGRSLVPGARLWRAGGATVVVVDDLRASPEALLSSLHRADVRTVDVLVVARPGRAAAGDVDALLRRFPPRLLLAPAGHRLPGGAVVPVTGATVTAGRLAVTVGATNPRLEVDVASTTARAPPGSVGSRMRLTLGPRSHDLTTRALVVGVDDPDFARVDDGVSLERALTEGARLVHLAEPEPQLLARCATAGVAVIIPAGSMRAAAASGLPADHVVPDDLYLDVIGSDCPSAAVSVGVIRGARIVRTTDVRGAQRVCDVLAAVMEAR